MGTTALGHLQSPLATPNTLGTRRKSRDPVGRNVFYPHSPPNTCVSRPIFIPGPAANFGVRTQRNKKRARLPLPGQPTPSHPTPEAPPSTPASVLYTATDFSSPRSPATGSIPDRAIDLFPHACFRGAGSPATDLAEHLEDWKAFGANDVPTPLRTPEDDLLVSPEEIRWAQLSGDPQADTGFRETYHGIKVSPDKGSPSHAVSRGFGSPFGVYDEWAEQLEPDLRSHRRFSSSDLRHTHSRVRSRSPPASASTGSRYDVLESRTDMSRPYLAIDYFPRDYSLNDPSPAQSTPPPAVQEYLSPDTPLNALLVDLGPSHWVSGSQTPSKPVIVEPFVPSFDKQGPHPLDNYRLNPEFAKRYSVDAELGSGGFGFVVSAVQTGYRNVPGVEVAVKFIIKNRLTGIDLENGLPREATILSMCRHLNIVAFVELYQDDEYFYLVQELHGSPWAPVATLPHLSPQSATYDPSVDIPHPTMVLHDVFPAHSPPSCMSMGKQLVLPAAERPGMGRRPSYDLFEAVEYKRFTEEEARYIFRQIVEAVAYMHQQGIRHRDLKDENITIDKHLRVKIIDFGSAVVESKDEILYHDTFRGTMAYAPAEIILGHSYLAAPADVWALGILLSIIVTGESPFPSIAWALNGQVQLKRHAPRGVMEILSMCFTPDPRVRPPVEAILAHPWVMGHRGSI